MKCKTDGQNSINLCFLSLWLVKLLGQLECAVCPSSPDSCGVGCVYMMLSFTYLCGEEYGMRMLSLYAFGPGINAY